MADKQSEARYIRVTRCPCAHYENLSKCPLYNRKLDGLSFQVGSGKFKKGCPLRSLPRATDTVKVLEERLLKRLEGWLDKTEHWQTEALMVESQELRDWIATQRTAIAKEKG